MGKTAIIIQARVGSKRLPNKMLLPFYEKKGVYELLIIKLLKKYHPTQIFLATSTSSENDLLENIASSFDIRTYRGSEENVLSRFIEISKKYNIKRVIRICADNPFLQMDGIEKLFYEINSNDHLDYVSFQINKKPSILSHFGLWAEAVHVEALKTIEKHTKEPVFLEHVTNFIHSGKPDFFQIKWINIDGLNKINDIRLTLDTQEDFNMQQNIFKALYRPENEIKVDEILNYLKSNKELKKLMKREIVRNEK